MSELDGEGFGDDCDMWFDALSTEDAPLTPRGRSPDSGIVTPPEALTSTDANDSRHDDSGSNEAPQNAADEQRVMFACYDNDDDDDDHCDSESKLKSSKRLLRSVSDIGVQCSALLGDCCDSPDDGVSSPIGRVLPLRRSASISDGELAALSGDEDSSDVVDSAVRSSSGENQDQMPGGSRVLRTVPRIGSSSAEARLAARRAARAEARQIRLKEIERRRKEQKEEADGTEDDSGAPVTPLSGASSSCGEPPPPAPQPMASGGLRTMGRLGSTVPSGTGSLSSGSRRSSQDSLNEEKDLPLGLRELRQEYRELEDRFNKAMITNAQLDNEKAAMQYQCENLKDVIVDLREALCRMQKENKLKSRECEAFRRAAESLKEDNRKLKDEITERDMLVQSVGLVMVYSEELDERGRPKRALVTPESAQLLDDAGEGSLDVRIKKFAEEKNELQDTIRRLTLDLEDERNKNSKFTKLMASSSPTANGPSSTDEWIDVQKENNRLVAEYKAKVQRSEQEIVTLQANVARLDSQVTRYKTAAESAEKNEEELKLEKRKLLRELRESQEKLEEAETKRSHLEKRLEKLKNARSALLKEISES